MGPVEMWAGIAFKNTDVSFSWTHLVHIGKDKPSSHVILGRERNGVQEAQHLSKEAIEAQSTEADGWFEKVLEQTRVLVSLGSYKRSTYKANLQEVDESTEVEVEWKTQLEKPRDG